MYFELSKFHLPTMDSGENKFSGSNSELISFWSKVIFIYNITRTSQRILREGLHYRAEPKGLEERGNKPVPREVILPVGFCGPIGHQI